MTNVVALRAPLTRESIFGRKTTNAVHMDLGGRPRRSAWMYAVEGIPRLMVWEETGKPRTWGVDGKACRDLDAAIAVLNGTMKLEEAMVQEAPPAQRPKKSLAAQIAEMDFQIDERKQEYDRMGVGATPRQQSVLELRIENMRAVRATLVWLQENEPMIRQRFS